MSKADVRDVWSVDHVDKRLREANWAAFRGIADVLDRFPSIRIQVRVLAPLPDRR